MKNIFTILALCLSFSLFGQKDIIVKINHKIGAENFAMNTTVTCYDGYDLEINRLEYYLCSFKITHDGGQETLTANHFLINANELTEINLGNYDITEVESVTFSVGVEESRNHLDPSVLPSDHPLAPQNPSMHWGWASGYRFVALEGKSGDNNTLPYQIHALGDAHFQTLTVDAEGIIDGNTLTIGLDTDYLGMFKNMDVSTGIVTHGDFGEAITLLENFASEVFFPEGGVPVAVISPSFAGKFQIQPNPSFEKITTVTLDLPIADNYQLILTDLAGRVIQTQTVGSGNQNIKLTSIHSGIYFIHLWKDGEPIAVEKWMVK